MSKDLIDEILRSIGLEKLEEDHVVTDVKSE
jgi:hypothetical protein